MKQGLNRREFIQRNMTAAASVAAGTAAWGQAATGEEMTTLEFGEYRDEATGARVRMLTQGAAKDQVIYQTHPMWTPGMDFLVFHSDRSGAGRWPHAIEMKTGVLRGLVDRACKDGVLARKDDRFYFLGGRGVCVTAVRAAFGKGPAAEVVAPLPDWAMQTEGGFSLDANEGILYSGVILEKDKQWALAALDLASKSWRKVVELDFRIGHVQANPFVSGVIMFCHETGGDAPQRMWVVNDDGAGRRPFYKETYGEWVTHEAWWGPDRAIFTIWPYDDERKKKPHGIVSADLATGAPTVHSQYPAWHTHGSPDGQWALGDDFDRNIWLVKIATGERRLLTQGHNGKGFSTHPHASFTLDSKTIVFNSSRAGTEDVYLVELPDWDSLKKL